MGVFRSRAGNQKFFVRNADARRSLPVKAINLGENRSILIKRFIFGELKRGKSIFQSRLFAGHKRADSRPVKVLTAPIKSAISSSSDREGKKVKNPPVVSPEREGAKSYGSFCSGFSHLPLPPPICLQGFNPLQETFECSTLPGFSVSETLFAREKLLLWTGWSPCMVIYGVTYRYTPRDHFHQMT